MLPWLAIPLMTLGARFSGRGIAAGLALSLVLLVAVALAVDARAVVDNPPLLVRPARPDDRASRCSRPS